MCSNTSMTLILIPYQILFFFKTFLSIYEYNWSNSVLLVVIGTKYVLCYELT